MRIDVSKMRHRGAPPPLISLAPPGAPGARRFLPSRWLPFTLFIALTLSVVLSARFLAFTALAETTDTSSFSTLAETGDADGARAESDSQPDESVPDDSTVADAPAEGLLWGRYTTSSRGGTRPAPSVGAQVASTARQYEGAPYRWAGASPAGFDCSGFTMYVYSKVGVSLPRDHWGQLNTGKRVGMDELQPGDIVFFENTYARGLSHSGIYLGDNQFIHAETEWTGVVITNLRGNQWERGFAGASRPYQQE